MQGLRKVLTLFCPSFTLITAFMSKLKLNEQVLKSNNCVKLIRWWICTAVHAALLKDAAVRDAQCLFTVDHRLEDML